MISKLSKSNGTRIGTRTKSKGLLMIVLLVSFFVITNFLARVSAATNQLCANEQRDQAAEKRWGKVGARGEREPRKPITTTTTTTAPLAQLTPNPAWQLVMGYSESFSKCSDLCSAYQASGCSEMTASDYCSALFSVDLGKNGNIDSSTFGGTPAGGTTCDTNVHCYDVVKNCECSGGQTLNLGACVQFLYSSFTKLGLNFVQAYSTVSQNLHGNCGTPAPRS